MSRAFVKEDTEAEELRSGRKRGAAVRRFLTAEGASELQRRLERLKREGGDATEIEEVLAAATVVLPPKEPATVVFGATVILERPGGERESYRIVGVDEVDLAPGNISWISPLAKALLGAELGQRVRLPGEQKMSGKVVSIL